jgi:hypothetical protein
MENPTQPTVLSGERQTERLMEALATAHVRKQGVSHVAASIEKNLGGIPIFIVGSLTDAGETKPVRWATTGAALINGKREPDYDLVLSTSLVE